MAKQYSKKRVERMDEELQAMVEDSDRLHDLKAVFDKKGGKMLIDALVADIIHSMETLAGGYKQMPHADMMAHCATLQVNLNLVQTLYAAKEGAEEVDELIAEKLKSSGM